MLIRFYRYIMPAEIMGTVHFETKLLEPNVLAVIETMHGEYIISYGDLEQVTD